MIYDNTKKFGMYPGGKIKSVALQVKDIPGQKYVVSHLRLIDEVEARGRNVAFCSSTDGRGDIYLTYPFDSFNYFLSSGGGNSNHPITNGYSPPSRGPLSICLGNLCESQLVMGLGLPFNRHVSYEIVFSPVSDGNPTDPTNPDLSLLTARIEILERQMEHVYTWGNMFGEGD